MENTDPIADPQAERPRWIMYLIPVALLLGLTLAFFAYRAWSASGTTSSPPGTQLISQAALEEQYGLRVHLIGVTAAGGLIDFRLQIMDAEKAQGLLEDTARTPSLWIEENDTTLVAVPEMLANLKLEDGELVFFLLPNARNAVKPGTPVTVQFGDLRIEPIPAQ